MGFLHAYSILKCRISNKCGSVFYSLHCPVPKSHFVTFMTFSPETMRIYGFYPTFIR